MTRNLVPVPRPINLTLLSHHRLSEDELFVRFYLTKAETDGNLAMNLAFVTEVGPDGSVIPLTTEESYPMLGAWTVVNSVNDVVPATPKDRRCIHIWIHDTLKDLRLDN